MYEGSGTYLCTRSCTRSMPMSLEQARKMVKGTLKGDSAMSKAIQELIDSGGDLTLKGTKESVLPSPGERGAHTLATMKAQQEAW